MPLTIFQSVKRVGVSRTRLAKTVDVVLQKLRQPEAIVSLHLIGDTRMKTLNATYRGKQTTTDVLSFGTDDHGLSDDQDWGDIYISIPQIIRQARREHITFEEECLRMLIHGVLHVFGYDHIKPTDADRMFGLQETLLKQLVPNKRHGRAQLT